VGFIVSSEDNYGVGERMKEEMYCRYRRRQIMGIRRWRKQCKEREERRRITEKAKTHIGFVMP
jgi:hypothetical protein